MISRREFLKLASAAVASAAVPGLCFAEAAKTSADFTIDSWCVRLVADARWRHIAIVRNGAALKFFVDGIESTADHPDIVGFAPTLLREAQPFLPGLPPEPWADYEPFRCGEFRITRGVARDFGTLPERPSPHSMQWRRADAGTLTSMLNSFKGK